MHEKIKEKKKRAHESKFLVRMRGTFTEPPRMEEPMKKIPQAAPITDKVMQSAMPKSAHMYGDVTSKKLPTSK